MHPAGCARRLSLCVYYDLCGLSSFHVLFEVALSKNFLSADDSIEFLEDSFPPEKDTDELLAQAQLVAVNRGRELLVYGGKTTRNYQSQVQASIWMFEFATRRWRWISSMQEERQGHVVLPVNGVTC